MKTGLVLEGGAMRGMYTMGVLDVMMEHDLWVDGAVGVSAGAVFGCNYKSRQSGRAIRYNMTYCNDSRYMDLRSFIKNGDIVDEPFCYHTLPYELDVFDQETYRENPMDFYVVCTDVHTGKPVYHLCNEGGEEDIQWMRASASMPLVSRPVTIGGQTLLDGGISDSIPIDWFQKQGYEKNIVILTQSRGYRKHPSKMQPLLKRMLKKYPAVVKDMEKRHEVYNKELERLEELKVKGEALVIQPSKPVVVSRMEKNRDKIWDLYVLGRRDALRQLDEIRKFIQ